MQEAENIDFPEVSFSKNLHTLKLFVYHMGNISSLTSAIVSKDNSVSTEG